MKKLIVTTLASLAAVAVFGQGQVAFVNLNGAAGVNAPVLDGLNTTLRLAGANYQAGLFAGSTSTSLAYIGNATPFLTAGGAGYFNGGATTLAGIPGGSTVWLQVVAWDATLKGTATGASWAQATAFDAAGANDVWGMSKVFSVVAADPTTSPPQTPSALVGLQSFALSVPEPSTFALMGLGAAALMIFRRRK
jgi:hypothetical protein